MKPALLLLIAMCFGVTYGANWAMNRVLKDDVFGDATVKEIQQANNMWKGK